MPGWPPPSRSPVGVDPHAPPRRRGRRGRRRDHRHQHHRRPGWAIAGPGGAGAGRTRFLHAHAERVVELDRPRGPPAATGQVRPTGRDQRRPRGAGSCAGWPAPASGPRAALSVPLAARRSRPPPGCHRQLHALVIATPALPGRPQVARPASWWRPGPGGGSPPTGRSRPRAPQPRCRAWRPPDPGADQPGRRPPPGPPGAGRAWRPDLLAPRGGPILAATVLGAWSQAGPAARDAACAMAGGPPRSPASSGQTIRARPNRSGTASPTRPYTVVLTRLGTDPATRPSPDHRRAQPRPPPRSHAAGSTMSPASAPGSSRPSQQLTPQRNVQGMTAQQAKQGLDSVRPAAERGAGRPRTCDRAIMSRLL
jgi:transposase